MASFTELTRPMNKTFDGTPIQNIGTPKAQLYYVLPRDG